MSDIKMDKNRSPWFWIPSLYFAEGIPYVIVMTLSVIFYKRMGISNTDIALYTSWLYLPWVIKPLWSPIVDILKTKRIWIIIMQLIIGAGLAGVAFTIPVPNFFKYTLAFFWLLAFSSATHDIAADGFYMLGLSKHDQAFFVGIRSTFYRFAMLTGQGLLVILAGYLESSTGLDPIKVEVYSDPGLKTEILFEPGKSKQIQDVEKQCFIYAEEIQIGINKLNKDSANKIISAVDEWNIENHFYVAENTVISDSNPGWWKRNISGNLEHFLSKHFTTHTEEIPSGYSGNIGLIQINISYKPEANEKVVLNFSRESGDKSINLIKSYRLEFSDENWDKPAYALVQLDEKLIKSKKAVFVGRSGNITFSWSVVFALIALIFVVFSIYHRFFLPRPATDVAVKGSNNGFFKDFFETFALFFKKKEIGIILTFLLVYRLGESQLVKLASPFLLDAKEVGGLGITTGDLGLIYGTVGMISLTLGGIIGGILASRNGLKYWIWWMIIAMNLPNLVYVFLSYAMPESLYIIGASVVVEQFGYGFGFTAFMLYMIYISEGKHKTAHFAITTGFMALGMMIPGMISGWLQEIIGYNNFFIWVMICTIPGFVLIPFLKIDKEFGKKSNKQEQL